MLHYCIFLPPPPCVLLPQIFKSLAAASEDVWFCCGSCGAHRESPRAFADGYLSADPLPHPTNHSPNLLVYNMVKSYVYPLHPTTHLTSFKLSSRSSPQPSSGEMNTTALGVIRLCDVLHPLEQFSSILQITSDAGCNNAA
eukprot:6207047-Pleurochrysis_carterae.AAC.2